MALAQINPVVGDLSENVKKIISYIKKSKALKADLVAFPELAITGYPPEDLLLKPQFIKDNIDALDRVRVATKGITAVVGFVDIKDDIFNAAAILSNERLIDVYHKMYLPNYGVFDEYRYFQAGTRYPIYDIHGRNVGVNICEDIWYPGGPTGVQALAGAEVIVNINASPYHIGRALLREKMLSTRASDNSVIITYINTVGGQDELVFDGGSLVIDQGGNTIAKGEQFKEDLIVVDLNIDAVIMSRLHDPRRRQEALALEERLVDKILIPAPSRPKHKPKLPKRKETELSPVEEIYSALVLGTKDYVEKNRFTGVIIGLSGGIDSSLVASIAVDALGKANVRGLFMPSPYTTQESYEDTYSLAKNLGIEIIEIPITEIFETYLKILAKDFKGLRKDTTEENLQARIRGNLLMAFSNKFGWLVLTTGNKSEMSVGYATLYGDMAGGFAVIKDVPKTMAYKLCEWRNKKQGKDIIPERVLYKEPTAELKPGQKDSDVLPPYQVLDPILKAYVEDDRSFDEIINMGCDVECAQKVIMMIDRSEYKRRQAPPGIKITSRAFGRDRRFPITNHYKSY
ncbi:MAG TPA: NAD+ synthase [Nitrospiraceae bacterium]|nr:NAD+ synthase [Nitrospiraceae bacterium]